MLLVDVRLQLTKNTILLVVIPGGEGVEAGVPSTYFPPEPRSVQNIPAITGL